ncbi:GNAT family N-acetyltransferase [Chachezhania sediminis]|uniref:GNAT family N-acetyltransferase n=1 Tax=Chachezhania sediminis TaxID=2599291 RepID=UPI00131EBECB|nr:GNAT family N-acetyltransferase [Chachezhania sediminis]
MSISSRIPVAPGDIAAVRQFNLFHARILASLAADRPRHDRPPGGKQQDAAAPGLADLARTLQVAPGELGRILAGLQREGLLDSAFAAGLAAMQGDGWDRPGPSSADSVEALLAPLSSADRRQLVQAMARVQRLLDNGVPASRAVLRAPSPGDLSWIIHRDASLHAAEHGWDWTYEALVADTVAGFVSDFDPSRDRAWVAELDGSVTGSVMIVHDDDRTARLRLLWIDPETPEQDLGRRLLDEAVQCARAGRNRAVTLSTNEMLTAAGDLYRAIGFVRDGPAEGQMRETDLIGQTWTLTL